MNSVTKSRRLTEQDAALIEKTLKTKGLTRHHLKDELGVTYASLSNYLSRRRNVSPEKLKEIECFLGISFPYTAPETLVEPDHVPKVLLLALAELRREINVKQLTELGRTFSKIPFELDIKAATEVVRCYLEQYDPSSKK